MLLFVENECFHFTFETTQLTRVLVRMQVLHSVEVVWCYREACFIGAHRPKFGIVSAVCHVPVLVKVLVKTAEPQNGENPL